MKCNFCNRETNWDDSVGKRSFIVCNPCVEKLRRDTNKRHFDIVADIIKIGIYKDLIESQEE